MNLTALTARPVADLRAWWCGDIAGGVAAGSPFACAWIGQAGFLLRFGDIRVVIDPYLSDSLARKYQGKHFPHTRMVPVPIKPEELVKVDFVLSTHEHTDHMDPESLAGIARVSPEAVFIVPRYSASVAHERGIPPERSVAINTDETITFPGGFSVTAFPAAHEDYVSDAAGNSKFLGYLFSCGGPRVFHSGDTVPFGALEERLSGAGNIELALLPVNGRDEVRKSRGVPGNMTIQEALQYHRSFSFRSTIVQHFGMFDFNTVSLDELACAIQSQDLSQEQRGNVIIPATGTLYE